MELNNGKKKMEKEAPKAGAFVQARAAEASTETNASRLVTA